MALVVEKSDTLSCSKAPKAMSVNVSLPVLCRLSLGRLSLAAKFILESHKLNDSWASIHGTLFMGLYGLVVVDAAMQHFPAAF